jgi:cell division protein FtsL
MAQIDVEHFDVKPASPLQVAQEISRTKNMFVTTFVAAVIMVVIAALFMTMMV